MTDYESGNHDRPVGTPAGEYHPACYIRLSLVASPQSGLESDAMLAMPCHHNSSVVSALHAIASRGPPWFQVKT